jgi:Tfp pilus assembly protein PilZ
MRVIFNRKEAEFVHIVEQLEELERVCRVNPLLDATMQNKRLGLERRLVELISLDRDERRDRVRLLCDLPVMLTCNGKAAPGVVTDIGTGGVFIKTNARASRGDRIEIVIVNNSRLGDGLSVRGSVAWSSDAEVNTEKRGLGVAFEANDENTMSYVRAFVLELLREQLDYGSLE